MKTFKYFFGHWFSTCCKLNKSPLILRLWDRFWCCYWDRGCVSHVIISSHIGGDWELLVEIWTTFISNVTTLFITPHTISFLPSLSHNCQKSVRQKNFIWWRWSGFEQFFRVKMSAIWQFERGAEWISNISPFPLCLQSHLQLEFHQFGVHLKLYLQQESQHHYRNVQCFSCWRWLCAGWRYLIVYISVTALAGGI